MKPQFPRICNSHQQSQRLRPHKTKGDQEELHQSIPLSISSCFPSAIRTHMRSSCGVRQPAWYAHVADSIFSNGDNPRKARQMTTSSRAETSRPHHSKLSWRVAALAAVASLALTACSGSGSNTTELVVYSVSEAPIFIEGVVEETTIGDIRHRSGLNYQTLEQALVGQESLARWTTLSTVVDEDADKQTDLRSVTGHTNFDDGSSLTWLGSSVVELAKVPVIGQDHTYVVVGGTGKYFGAEGTLTTSLVDVDNLIFRSVYTLILE